MMAGMGTCGQQWHTQMHKSDGGYRQTRQVQTNKGGYDWIRWSMGTGASMCDSIHDE